MLQEVTFGEGVSTPKRVVVPKFTSEMSAEEDQTESPSTNLAVLSMHERPRITPVRAPVFDAQLHEPQSPNTTFTMDEGEAVSVRAGGRTNDLSPIASDALPVSNPTTLDLYSQLSKNVTAKPVVSWWWLLLLLLLCCCRCCCCCRRCSCSKSSTCRCCCCL